jgi:hypothetical protein
LNDDGLWEIETDTAVETSDFYNGEYRESLIDGVEQDTTQYLTRYCLFGENEVYDYILDVDEEYDPVEGDYLIATLYSDECPF